MPTPSPTPTPIPTPSPTPEAQTFVITDAPPFEEESVAVVVTVRRTGDLSRPAGVDYATADGTAREGYDYIMASGTLLFAPGESAKQVRVLLVNDAHGEQDEAFTLTLSTPWGGCSLGTPHAAVLTIRENDATPAVTNPVDEAAFFVGEHYADFLGREADASGRQFWTNEIESCGADAQCREVKRVNVSAAFFLSIESQETGYLVYRMHRSSFGTRPTFAGFMQDARQVGRDVIVGQTGWEQQLAANKAAFAEGWVQRPAFVAEFPTGMSAQDYVAKLFQRAGVTPTAAETQAAVAAYGTGDTQGRALALRSVVEGATVTQAHKSPAFVLFEYFGYLRRDPDEEGYNFWLGKLDEFNGNYIAAEMVKAFINSDEYRKRFGQ
jgi:hypothetical protein